MTRAKINPLILQWARQRLGLTEAQVAKKVRVGEKPHRVQAWEQGSEYPTFRQAQALARVLRIPLGYLFLSKLPITSLPIADFRTLPESQKGQFSPELEDVLNDALRKRDWLRERRLQEGYPPLPFVGRFSTKENPQTISEDIRQTLNLPIPTARDAKSWGDHLRFLVRQAENAGIMVLQSGYALRNTRRTLSAQEFRGFTLVDSYAPLIFLNSRDSVNGRIFTLAHELGHLWTGTSGVSNPEAILPQKETPAIERLCNQVAAELLVPAPLLREHWRDDQIDLEMIQGLTRTFRVSTFVVLIRGYELGLITRDTFQHLYNQALREIEVAQETREEPSGGDFRYTFPARNGRLLLREVAEALREGSLLYQDASQLLNIKTKTVEKALQEF
jgi:Zn-dependent peptidase ImmA (M78 family)/DNA-binding XRE family transcriptional regulator